jgi:hypothetical protein
MQPATATKATRGPTVRRQPQRTPSGSGQDQSSVSDLANQLFESRDFDGYAVPKLLSVQQHLPKCIKCCISDRQFPRAMEWRQFGQELQYALREQADILRSCRPQARVPIVTARSPYTRTSKYFSPSQDLTGSDDPIVQDFDRETRQREEILLTDHQRAMQQFEQRWADRVIRRYQQPSSRLRQLRVDRLDLLSAGDEEGAGRLQAEIEACEAEERQVAEDEYWNDYRRARKRMNEKLAGELGEFRAIRERLRAKLVVRSKGMYTGPFDQPPPTRSITAVRPRPFSSMAPRPKEQVLPPLYDTRERMRQPKRPSTTDAETQSGASADDAGSPPAGSEPEAEAKPEGEDHGEKVEKGADAEQLAGDGDEHHPAEVAGGPPPAEHEETAQAGDQRIEGIASALDQAPQLEQAERSLPPDEADGPGGPDVEVFITTGGTARDEDKKAEEEEEEEEATDAPAPEQSRRPAAVEAEVVPEADRAAPNEGEVDAAAAGEGEPVSEENQAAEREHAALDAAQVEPEAGSALLEEAQPEPGVNGPAGEAETAAD